MAQPKTNTISPLELLTPRGAQTVFFEHTDFVRLLSKYDKVLLIVDKRVRNLEHTQEVISQIQNSRDEVHEKLININNLTKNTELMLESLDEISKIGLSRKSLLIALGGGGTADLVGVTASMYMRGIDYGVIPTSFISMADGIISKVAVNHHSTKNMVGAFYSPRWIFIDTNFIDGTDKTRIVQGLTEVWKHALIERNHAQTRAIEKLLTSPVHAPSELLAICEWSMNVKAKYVLPDWEDTAGRHKALSLGHTLANFLEMHDTFHHAEAVFYGILFEALMANQKGLLNDHHYQSIVKTGQLFEKHFNLLPRIQTHLSNPELITALRSDKISSHGTIAFVLPTNTGYAVTLITSVELNAAIAAFTQLKLF